MNPSGSSLRPGEVWCDNDGKPIQAHGGGVLFHEGTCYWYGENKDAPNVAGTERGPFPHFASDGCRVVMALK